MPNIPLPGIYGLVTIVRTCTIGILKHWTAPVGGFNFFRFSAHHWHFSSNVCSWHSDFADVLIAFLWRTIQYGMLVIVIAKFTRVWLSTLFKKHLGHLKWWIAPQGPFLALVSENTNGARNTGRFLVPSASAIPSLVPVAGLKLNNDACFTKRTQPKIILDVPDSL